MGSMRVGALQGLFVVSTAAFAGLVVEGLVIDSDHWRHLFIVMALIWGLSDAAGIGRRPSGTVRQGDDHNGGFHAARARR